MEAVRVVRDSASQLGKGFGFVQFSDQQAARAALGCDGQLLRKRPIRVTKAVKVPAHLKELGRKEKLKRKPTSKDAADGKRSATAGTHGELICFDTLAVLICRQHTQTFAEYHLLLQRRCAWRGLKLAHTHACFLCILVYAPYSLGVCLC